MSLVKRGRTLTKREQQAVRQRKLSARLASTANVADLNAVSLTMDGGTIALNDRILLHLQTTGSQNGLYYAVDVGTTARLVRTDDFYQNDDVVSGVEVYIEEGTLWAGHTFKLMTANSIELGTTALTFTDVGGGTSGSSMQLKCVASVALSAGELVYVSGWNTAAALPEVAKADADSTTVGVRRPTWVVGLGGIGGSATGYVFKTYSHVSTLNGTKDNPVYLSAATAGASSASAPATGSNVIVGRFKDNSATATINFDLREVPVDMIATADIKDGTIIPADVDLTQGYDWTGQHTFTIAPKTDAIAEKTSGTGVTVDGMLIRDEQIQYEVYNDTGGAFTPGMLLYVSGWNVANACPSVKKADADAAASGADILIRHPMFAAVGTTANGSVGRGATVMSITGVETGGSSVGNPIYLDATTAGGWTLTAPSAADSDAVVVGRVEIVAASPGGAVYIDLDRSWTSIIGTSSLQALAVTNAKIANATIADGKLVSQIDKDIGAGTAGYFQFNTDLAGPPPTGVRDGNTITIIGETYTFNAAGAGAFLIDMSGAGAAPWDGTESAIAAAITINTDSTKVTALAVSGAAADNATLLLAAKTGSQANGGLSVVLTDAGVIVPSAANTAGQTGAAVRSLTRKTYTVTAQDEATLIDDANNKIILITFPVAGSPSYFDCQCRTSGGAIKSLATCVLAVEQIGAGGLYGLTITDNGAAILANGDVLTYTMEV